MIQRGLERRNVFFHGKDKKAFFRYLEFARTAYEAIIHSYVLMDNHYHLILETPRGNLSKIMHYINTGYAAYFNAKYKRAGPLYQGRYKSIIVQKDEYLHHLSGYIHLNPVRCGLTDLPDKYPWSSYGYFTSMARPPAWLRTYLILSVFDTDVAEAKRSYMRFVLESIGKEGGILEDNTRKGLVLGDEGFLDSIRRKFIDKEDPEVPVLRELRLAKEPALEYIKYLSEQLPGGDHRMQKRLSIYLARKYTQMKLGEIARFYGNISDAGVSQAARRTQIERSEDKELDGLLKRLEKDIESLNVET